MSFNADYSALQSVKYNLARLSVDMRKQGEQAIKRCAENLLMQARALAPMDTGALRESGKVKKISNSEYQVIFDVTVKDRMKKLGKPLDGVSNPNFHYSGLQHDMIDWKHKIGQALFLEEPYEANKDGYMDTIKNAIQNTIRRTNWQRRSSGWSRRGRR